MSSSRNTRNTRRRALRVVDLHAGYGAVQVLHGISLEVFEGEIVTLIGANGAGKSTTLRVLSGLLRPKRGQIYVWDEEVTDLRADRLVRMGVAHCPEGRMVFPSMTVRENLILGAYTVSDGRQIAATIDEMFQRFPILRERRNQLAGTLSGGEQEMLAIARALMSRPRLLLLDEPSLGLSPIVVDQIFDLLVELNREGLSILLVEQNANLALEIAQRAYVMQTGEIMASGFTSDLLEHPIVKASYLGG